MLITRMSLFNKILFTFLFLSVIINQSAYCQSTSTLNWTTDSEFLPQNSIKSIAPDKYGFIWMTTENGLVRYDGKNFVVYNGENTGIKNNRLIYITGNYLTDSLYTFNDQEEDYIFINSRKATKVNTNKHPKAVLFKSGTDRFTATGIPSVLLDQNKRPYRIPVYSNNSYYLIDNNQIRYFDAKNKLLSRVYFEYEANSNFFTFDKTLFYFKKNGDYAIIQNGKIVWKKLPIPSNIENRLYWNITSGQVFLYINKKLYQIEYKSGVLKKSLLIENEDLILNRVVALYRDDQNKLIYLGSSTKGLCIYREKSFNTITPPESEQSEIFYAINQFNDSTIISASGIMMTKDRIVGNLKFSSAKYGMTIDDDENIWTYEGSKLLCYKKGSNYTKAEWELQKPITSIFKDKKGMIWFGLLNQNDGSDFLHYFKPEENPVFKKHVKIDSHISFIAQSDEKSLWIGSKKGLYYHDIITKKTNLIDNTKDLKIRNIYISDHNNIWITTYDKGFYLVKNKKIFSFPLDINGYLSSSHCILEDKKGFFWVSTNKGLFQISKKNLLDYTEKKIKNLFYKYYNKDFGFLTNEFNGGCMPCGVQTNKGDIFLPSINGVVSFNPNNIPSVLPNNGIYIDEALVDDKKVIKLGDTLHLNRKFERITFSITSPYYGNINNLNFEAKLEGPDAFGWAKVSKEHNISFTTLHPGTYVLTVRKIADFESNYDYKKITIIIEPAFWQTLLFKIIILGSIIMLGFVLYKLRIKYISKHNLLLEIKINEQTNDLKNTIGTLRATRENLKKQIDNNTKIIQYITHDIKSPLKFMTMASKYMYETFDKKNEDLKENIQAIFTSSSQMFNFVDNLLEYSKVYLDKGEIDNEEFKIHDVINEKIALFENIAYSQKTAIKNRIAKDAVLRKNKQLFSIIIHNLLDNALKNTLQGSITFHSDTNDEYTNISISDTGNGMDKSTIEYYQTLIDNYDLKRDKKYKTMGLHIVIELLLILNGKMIIDSTLNKGTTIILTFENNNI